jgi:HAMP domain-containing protein
VPDHELLKRLDEHLARGNELHELNIREHQLNRASYERGIEMMLGITERHERLVEENVRVLRQLTTAFAQGMAEIRSEMKLVRERMEAQTEAIFRMLDRLDGNDGPAAA